MKMARIGLPSAWIFSRDCLPCERTRCASITTTPLRVSTQKLLTAPTGGDEYVPTETTPLGSADAVSAPTADAPVAVAGDASLQPATDKIDTNSGVTDRARRQPAARLEEREARAAPATVRHFKQATRQSESRRFTPPSSCESVRWPPSR